MPAYLHTLVIQSIVTEFTILNFQNKLKQNSKAP